MAKYPIATRCFSESIGIDFNSKAAAEYVADKIELRLNDILSENTLNIINKTFKKWFNKSLTEISNLTKVYQVPAKDLGNLLAGYAYGESMILVNDTCITSEEIMGSILAHELVHAVQYKFQIFDLDAAISGFTAAMKGDWTNYLNPMELEAYSIQMEILNEFNPNEKVNTIINSIKDLLTYHN